ncbi:GYD domain-containing protein [Nitrospira sp. Nam74]
MATYLIQINWTDQGIRNIKDSPKRLDAAKKTLKDLGGEVKGFYMTQGASDALLIVDVPTDEALANFVLKVGSAGNVRTSTVRAYAEDEYRRIIGGVS